MITQLIETLRRLDPPLTAEEIADALWLAQRLRSSPGTDLGRAAGTERAGLEKPEPPTSLAPDVPPAPRPEPARPAASPGRASDAGLYLAGKHSTTPHLIRSPAPPAIPHALLIARALRPLRVTGASPTRRWLDERETARKVAETGVWEPVMRPSPERWLDLALVVDTGPSMIIWRQTIEELQAILEQLGAFRDVRVWRMNTADPALPLHTGAGGSARNPNELIGPTRRRMILVVSDCIGAAWQNGQAAALLDRWGRAGPVAIVQPLPQRLWWRCAAALHPVHLGAKQRGAANHLLATRALDSGAKRPPGIPVPVMELDPRWLRPWARMIGIGNRDMRGAALFTGDPVAELPVDTGVEEPDPVARVMRFRAASSPLAFRLASHLAAAPLRLPVMRLVQHAMSPEPEPAHLAEVFLGGLLRGAHIADGAGQDAVEYEFHDGVRDVLLSGLDRGEALGVLRAVWDVVRANMGSSLDFPALLKAIQRDESGLRPDQPFAQVTARVLARLGGRYGEVARQLAAAAPEPGTRRAASAGARTGESGPGPANSASAPRELAETVLWGGVPARNFRFTGREGLLRTVRTKLDEAVTVLLPQLELGSGGEGKSQLAVEYAHRYSHEYDLIWWIPAEQMTSAQASLAALARRLGTPLSDDIKYDMENVLHALRTGTPRSRWLLIYDNAMDPAELVPLMPVALQAERRPMGTPIRTGHVLVTSRDHRWKESVAAVQVGAFERHESVSVILRHAPHMPTEQADLLAARVEDLPLAVEQLAAWTAATRATAEDCLRRFDRKLADLPVDELPEGFPAHLAAALELTFERLREDAPGAGSLLELWAFFGPEPVTGSLLAAGAELPAPLGRLLADEAMLETEMRNIDRFALARFDAGEVSLQVHRLIRTMLRVRLAPTDRARVRDQVHRVLADATPDAPADDETTWGRRAAITPHVVPAEVFDSDDAGIRWGVVIDQIRYLWRTGDFESSRVFAEIALARWTARHGPDDEQTLIAGRELANAQRSLGDIGEASRLNEETFSRMTERLGPGHPSTLLTANSFGADLRLRGDFRHAYSLDMDTWRRLRQRYEDDHEYTLRAANSVGIDLRLLGDFHQAYEVDSDTLRRLQAQPGSRKPAILLTTDHLSRDLHGLGRYAEALWLQQSSIEERRQVLGPTHAPVLRAAVSHAGTLRKLGRYADARRLAAETLDLHVRRFGELHPDTLAARRSLAIACLVTGDARDSRRLGEEALAGYRTVLGADHPFTHACAAGLGLALRALGEYQAALAMDQAALDALSDSPLGPDHHYALCCLVGLANDLYLLGELDAAYEHSKHALERFRSSFGPDHPYTLACAHDHAVICRAAGQVTDTGLERPIAALRRVLGADHPEVGAAADGELLECDIEPTSL
ncbi:hypothetical protein DPM19_22565 [Actinomadura craniellae]|uniref:Tetratricopeptide repeat protein n=1 Tax=Actinomadura craniellae TaxID=2231787 RepID=A0A365H199_9ACTN|nr:FxSxx-COOH system tetratricopeptide repeat protein [Actinomadura craniellae]RAY12806.1 hypothetical protein DPM19_22565 [Actinomadura craniellae]